MKRFFSSSFVCVVFICQVQLLAAEKPNIILIMADDFGYECVGRQRWPVRNATPRQVGGNRHAV